MFTRHVSRQLSAYLHDELPVVRARAIAEHLVGCNRCRVVFEEIKLGAALAQKLVVLPAPDTIWPEIEATLDAAVTRRRSETLSFRPRLAWAVGLAMLVLAGFFWWRSNPTAPVVPQASWRVARLDGAPRVGSMPLNANGRLVVGEWLETDANSRARVDVSTIGKVEVDRNTRVRILESKPTEHRLELQRGRLSASITAPPKLFFVNTPSGVAEDLGCAYTLEVDDYGNSLLHVTAGWVSLQLTNRESTVPAGAACATRKGVGPGTPYFEDASPAFRAALQNVDFAAPSSAEKDLDTVLNEARPRDTMTLLYLLARVNQGERGRVYDRMTALMNAPAGVTRAGMLNLDEQMMQRWKQQLGLAWNSGGVWRKIWSSGLGRINGLQGKR